MTAPSAGPGLLGGLDLGGTKIQAVVMDAGHTVLGSARQPTPTTGGPQDVADAMVATMKAAGEAAGVDTAHLTAVGAGSPGAIDAAAGTVSGAGNLPGWTGSFPLGPVLSAALGAPVSLGNDVTVATQAEFDLGSGKPYSSLLGVFCGTGVGGGLILSGETWNGRGAAGEIGHMVVKRGGARCPCGRRGCMEAYAGRGAMELRARKLQKKGSTTKLFDIMEKKGRTRLASGVFAKALEIGDPVATALIDRAVLALGAGIASAVNLLDLEAIVVGGGLGLRLGEPFVDRIRDAMQPHLFVADRPPEMHLATLGDLGGAIGAGLLAESEHAAG